MVVLVSLYRPEEVPEIGIADIRARVKDELQPLLERISLNDRVAITAGSRDIANIVGDLARVRRCDP